MKLACLLSLVLHGLVFFLIALWMHFSKDSDFLEKTFSVSLRIESNEEAPEGMYKIIANGTDIDDGLKEFIAPIEANKSSAVPYQEPEYTTIESFKERDIKIGDRIVDADRAHTSRTTHLRMPRMRKSQPRIHLAKSPISPKRQKHVIQKLNKMTEKLHETNVADSLFVWNHKDRAYTVRIHRVPAKTATGLDEVVYEISTREGGYSKTTKVRMRRVAFSHFAHFVDFWDPWVAAHDDQIEGWFHTNSDFAISGDGGVGPKFNGRVTTSGYDVETVGSFPFIDYESVFVGGLETGVDVIRVPKTFTLFTVHVPLDSQRVHIFTEETWITFYEEGSYYWTMQSSRGFERRKTISNEPYFIIGRKKTRIHVKGIVKGKILVYSEGNIVIDDDLFYSRQPEEFEHADDYLGLVSMKDIEIAKPSVTGPGDLFIYGAIHARRRFRVPYFHRNDNASLNIYGSLSAGSISATEPRYSTRVVFDIRFDTNRPPLFPMTDHYEIIEWDRRWTYNH